MKKVIKHFWLNAPTVDWDPRGRENGNYWTHIRQLEWTLTIPYYISHFIKLSMNFLGKHVLPDNIQWTFWWNSWWFCQRTTLDFVTLPKQLMVVVLKKKNTWWVSNLLLVNFIKKMMIWFISNPKIVKVNNSTRSHRITL